MPHSADQAAPAALAHASLEFMDLLGYIYLQHQQPGKAAVLLRG